MENVVEVVVIGAGPIGIEMGIALRRAEIAFRQFEAGSIGSTIAWYSPGTYIFSSPERLALAGYAFGTYPGGKVTREEYLQYLCQVAHAERLPIECGRRIIDVNRDGDEFVLTVARSDCGVGGERYRTNDPAAPIGEVRCKKVVLAIGNMHLPNLLGISGEELKHVSHFLGDVHGYYGRRVIIVGGKNSAAEAAVRLARLYTDVTVVQRGNGFEEKNVKPWLLPEINSLLRAGRIKLVPDSCLTAIESDAVVVRGESGVRRIPADVVLLLTGYVQDTTLLARCGIELEGNDETPYVDLETMETNVPGIYAIGTASVGTERGHVTSFIETSHAHIPRVMRSLGFPLRMSLLNPRTEEYVES